MSNSTSLVLYSFDGMAASGNVHASATRLDQEALVALIMQADTVCFWVDVTGTYQQYGGWEHRKVFPTGFLYDAELTVNPVSGKKELFIRHRAVDLTPEPDVEVDEETADEGKMPPLPTDDEIPF